MNVFKLYDTMPAMHPVQQAILELARTRNIGVMKLREIAAAINEELPQTIKYHQDMLIKRGFLERVGDKDIRFIDPNHEIAGLIQIPILGQANAGPATIYAEDSIQGFLPVSPSLLKTRQYQNLFAVQAVGRSMNASSINGKSIQDGDYVIAKQQAHYENNTYVVASVNGLANIKRLIMDHEEGHIILQSESLERMPPIYIAEEDIDHLQVHGRVIQVLKAPRNADLH